MNQEYLDRVDVLEDNLFVGKFVRGCFEVNYSNNFVKMETEKFYIESNQRLRLMEAIIRVYPDTCLWEKAEYFVYGDSDVEYTRSGIQVHVYFLRKVIRDSRYAIKTIYRTGIKLVRKNKHQEYLSFPYRGL